MLYRDYRPSAFDHVGLGLEDRQDWTVVVGRNRDSSPLEQSNFHSMLDALGGESDTVEVHRFGHWACGWLEVVLAAPSRAEEVAGMQDALADYPVFDDDDLAAREHDGACETWDACRMARDMMEAVIDGYEGLSERACDLLRAYAADHADALWRWHMNAAPEPYTWHENECSFHFDYLRTYRGAVDVATLAEWIRIARNDERNARKAG